MSGPFKFQQEVVTRMARKHGDPADAVATHSQLAPDSVDGGEGTPEVLTVLSYLLADTAHWIGFNHRIEEVLNVTVHEYTGTDGSVQDAFNSLREEIH